LGVTENARHETAAQGNMQEWKMRHKTAGLENVTKNPGLDNARKVSMESEQTLCIS